MTTRIGIIGCGGIAGMHARSYKEIEGIELVACTDIDPKRAKEFAAANGVKKVYADFRKLIAAGRLDAVSVCTPNYAHCEPTVAALEAGINVFCEKPIGMNAREAETMAAAARRTKRLLTIGHHMRFRPEAQYLHKMIAGGEFGPVYFGRSFALRRRGIPGWGAFHITAKSGGGPLIDIGVHALDLIMWIMGSPKPVAVSGAAYTKFGNRPDFHSPWGDYKRADYDVEDFACGFVRFDNGATLALEASWAAHLPFSESLAQTILGERAGAVLRPFSPDKEPALEIFQSRGEALVDVRPSGFADVNVYVAEMKRWVACLRGEAEVLVKPEESVNVQRVIDSVYLSSERSREVVIAEEFGSKKK